MLFDDIETKKAINAIRSGSQKWTKKEIGDLLSVAKKRKEYGFDAASMGAQVRYKGRQQSVIKEALKKVFPESFETFPIAGINWLKLFARLDAGVYVVPPDRFLEDEKGERLPVKHEASRLWAWALRKSRLHVQMAEAERHALVTPGCCIGLVVWRPTPGGVGGCPEIEIYWPHDVEVLCHWAAPTSWAHRYVVCIRQAAPETTSGADWYLVWSRVPPEQIDGEWGDWESVLVSTNGDVAALPEKYQGQLCPTFLVQLTDPGGHPFTFEDTDLLDATDDLNVRKANESYVINMQGHDQIWTDDQREAATLKVGPDTILPVTPDATMGMLSPNPKLNEMRLSREQALRELATSRGNSPHAYVTKAGGPPQSGVAMRIENIAHDTRVAEQAVLMQIIEEEEVLPIMKDVVMAHHPDGKRLLQRMTPRMTPRKLPTFEDPNQKQERLGKAVDRGWITDARAAADLELYPDAEVAKSAIDQIAKDKPAPIKPPLPAPPKPGDPPVDETIAVADDEQAAPETGT